MNIWNLPLAMNIAFSTGKCRFLCLVSGHTAHQSRTDWLPVIFHTSRQWLQRQTGLQRRKGKTAVKWSMLSFEQFSRPCEGVGNSSSDWPLRDEGTVTLGTAWRATSTQFNSNPLKLWWQLLEWCLSKVSKDFFYMNWIDILQFQKTSRIWSLNSNRQREVQRGSSGLCWVEFAFAAYANPPLRQVWINPSSCSFVLLHSTLQTLHWLTKQSII